MSSTAKRNMLILGGFLLVIIAFFYFSESKTGLISEVKQGTTSVWEENIIPLFGSDSDEPQKIPGSTDLGSAPESTKQQLSKENS
jgi:hypothetical protein